MELAARYRAGETEVLGQLLEDLGPVILTAASRAAPVAPKWVDWDDLLQQASLIIIEMLRGWRPRKNVPFSGYVGTFLPRKLRTWVLRRCRDEKASGARERGEDDPDVTLWLVAQNAPGWPVVRAVAVEGYSLSEAAELLGTKKSTAYDKYRRGLLWLRDEVT